MKIQAYFLTKESVEVYNGQEFYKVLGLKTKLGDIVIICSSKKFVKNHQGLAYLWNDLVEKSVIPEVLPQVKLLIFTGLPQDEELQIFMGADCEKNYIYSWVSLFYDRETRGFRTGHHDLKQKISSLLGVTCRL